MLSFKSKLSSDIINVKHLYKKFAEACSFRSIKDTKPRKRRNFTETWRQVSKWGWKKGINNHLVFHRKCQDGRSRSPVRADEENCPPLRWLFSSQACSSFVRATSTFIAPMRCSYVITRQSGPMLPGWPGIELIKADLSEIALSPPFFPSFCFYLVAKLPCFFGQSFEFHFAKGWVFISFFFIVKEEHAGLNCSNWRGIGRQGTNFRFWSAQKL